MIRTKKFWIFSILLFCLAGGVWFFFTGHSAPAHARYVPGDATAVVTINTKRILADILLGGELKQDTGLAATKTFAKWKKAAEANGGTGISMSADVLLFSCVSPAEKQLYGGVVMKTDDADLISRFITKELPNLLDTSNYITGPLTENKTYKTAVISIGPFADEMIYIGYNKEAFVALKAESHGWTPDLALKEMDRIFNEPKEHSVASNENFRNSERRPADVSLWFNYNHRQFKHLFNQNKDTAAKPGYVNAWLDFNKGSADLTVYTIPANRNRSQVFRKSHSENDFLKLIAADKFIGLLHGDIDLQNLLNNLNNIGNAGFAERTAEQWGLTTGDVVSSFDGKADLALNGFVHYQKKYIAYEYDANFNKIEVEKYMDERMPGFVLRLGMHGSSAMLSLLPKLLNNKHILPFKSGYRLNSDIPVYMFPVGNNLYVCSSENLPKDAGKQSVSGEEITQLSGKHTSFLFCDLKGLRTELLKEFPNSNPDEKKAWDTFRSVSLSADEEPGGRTELSFSLKFSESKTNALVQLLNIFQEMKKHPY